MTRGRKPRYVKQVLETVKEKGMILQIDVAKKYNMQSTSGLNNSVIALVENNNIKRTKVKIRYSNGNLNDAWLLYLPHIDYNDIIDYERELINRPYKSPLEKNHCYKKETETHNNSNDIVLPHKNESNVIDMNDYIKINNKDVIVKEFQGQRVVTFKDIDNLHQRPSGTASRNYKNNKERFIENVDYFLVKPKDIQKDEIRLSEINNRGTIFITETGYMMLVKSFSDDLSWAVQRELVNTYFKVKQLKQDETLNHLPQIQNLNSLDMFELVLNNFKEQNNRIETLENKINTIVQVLSS